MQLTKSLQRFFGGRFLRRGRSDTWPFVKGKYRVLDATAPVVVVMADHSTIAADLAALSVRGLCMVSMQCRTASDLEKLLLNVDANLAVHFVLLAGGDENENPAVAALASLLGGADESPKKAAALVHAVRGHLSHMDFATLRDRVQVVDMRGCADTDKIIAKINKLASAANRPNTGFTVSGHDTTIGVERVVAATNISYDLQADKAGGYGVRIDKGKIVVDHYNSKGELLRIVEGGTARDLCLTLIRNGWVSKLDHAAYLGRELARAEIAVREGSTYAQNDLLRPGHETAPAGAKE